MNSDTAALRELFDLLEDYAPMWFTQEQRNRAVAALLRSADPHAEPFDAPLAPRFSSLRPES